ncbi:MAG: hypothetical protein Q7U91_16230 [Sideroxyarcus sp.]|nr:hypothetical protein [Sideroxyarcus sp.]
MIKLFKVATILSITLLISACGTTNIPVGTNPQLDADAGILVFGLSPNYRIHLTRGGTENNTWNRPHLDVPEINVNPEKGYIVVKARRTSGSQALGVSLIFPEGRTYGPCQGADSPTFVVMPGVVNYAGDLNYAFDDGGLRYALTLDENKVRTFLDENYPKFTDKLVVQPMTIMKTNSNFCAAKTITIQMPSK